MHVREYQASNASSESVPHHRLAVIHRLAIRHGLVLQHALNPPSALNLPRASNLPRAPAQPRALAHPSGQASQPTARPSATQIQVLVSSRPHVPRLTLNEECSICYSDALMSLNIDTEFVWCKGGCGKSMHTSCFEKWVATCARGGRTITCPNCLVQWVVCL
jgi:hypothetical protein